MTQDELKQQFISVEEEIQALTKRRVDLTMNSPSRQRLTGANLVQRAQIGACDRQLSVLRAKLAQIQVQIYQLGKPVLNAR